MVLTVGGETAESSVRSGGAGKAVESEGRVLEERARPKGVGAAAAAKTLTRGNEAPGA